MDDAHNTILLVSRTKFDPCHELREFYSSPRATVKRDSRSVGVALT